MKYENKEAFEQVNMFGTGTPNTAYAKFFIGDSFLNPLTDPKGSHHPPHSTDPPKVVREMAAFFCAPGSKAAGSLSGLVCRGIFGWAWP